MNLLMRLHESVACSMHPAGIVFGGVLVSDGILLVQHYPELPLTIAPLAFLTFTQSDEEPVDPIKDVRESCYKACPKQQQLYNACVERITAKKEGDCEAWFIELLTCADKCVAPKIFKLTKE